MIWTSVQHVAPVLPDRLRERLGSLGLTTAVVSNSGQVTLQGASRPIERLIVQTPQFAYAVRQQVPTLREHPGSALDIWPGVWLVPLPTPRRRRNQQNSGEFLATLLISHEIIESDQLHLVCDSLNLDHRFVAGRIDPATLISAHEVHRLATMLAWMQEDSVQIDRRTDELQSMSQNLSESYEELSLLYKLSTNMTINRLPNSFLSEACAELQQVVGLSWMVIQLVDDEPRLDKLAGKLLTAGKINCGPKRLRQVGRQLMERHQPTNLMPLVVDDTEELDVEHLPQLARQLLVVALQHEGRPLGVIFGGDKLDGSHISSIDSKLCNALANSMSIFLANKMLYQDMQGMFLGTLHALTSSIDAKDSYTHGHSERVAMLSRQLGQAAKLSAATCERLYLSGLIHDVGKIGVPESVLCKPGRLTADEFDLIKQHPQIGGRILQDIRQMQDLVPGVLHHHERWDGRGYPHGVAGKDIPLFGRVICLADSFDAMSSNRTYRPSLDHQRVLDEINNCAGSQFDPELASLFVQLDFSEYARLIEKHQNPAA